MTSHRFTWHQKGATATWSSCCWTEGAKLMRKPRWGHAENEMCFSNRCRLKPVICRVWFFFFSLSHIFCLSFSPGWADTSSLRGEKRARAGGRNPTRPRSALPIQDQGSYWNNQVVTNCLFLNRKINFITKKTKQTVLHLKKKTRRVHAADNM